MINPWKILGVHRKSTDEEIRQTFLALAKKTHPDVSKTEVDKFSAISKAHSMLKSKVIQRAWIDYFKLNNGICLTCSGNGVKTKSKGLTDKTYTGCKDCGGSGFNIKEEENDRAIELRGTAGAGGKGSHKKH